jgi:uncharacterized protein (TIGR02598 family)
MKTSSYRSPPPFLPRLRRAFSLVEVMVALAIAALGFTTLMGLLPYGLQLVQDTGQLSAESRIRQKLTGELLTAPWDQLKWTGYGPTRFFSDQGIELTPGEVKADGGTDGALTYVAAVQFRRSRRRLFCGGSKYASPPVPILNSTLPPLQNARCGDIQLFSPKQMARR